MILHHKNPTQFIETLGIEKERVKFLVARDGLIRAMNFIEQTHKTYRSCLKSGHAQEQLFRKSFVQSCIDFRKLMKYVEVYKGYLSSLHPATSSEEYTSLRLVFVDVDVETQRRVKELVEDEKALLLDSTRAPIEQHCHASRGDGECYWDQCPQLINYQSSCPLWKDDDEEY